MNTISQITANIYLSDKHGASNRLELDLLGINTVISLGHKDELQRYKYHPNKKYYRVEINDTLEDEIWKYFKACNTIIQDVVDRNEKILVHCNAGISRSSTIIISYLMNRGWDFLLAYNYLKEKRKIIQPNRNFITQLLTCYRQHISFEK